MNDPKKFEKWLADTAQNPAMRDLMAKAARAPEIPEEVLADYYAGELPEAERSRVERQILLSENNARYLAELDTDAGAAIPASPPRFSPAKAWHAVSRALSGAFQVPQLQRAAIGVTAAVALVVVGRQVWDRPPAVGPVYGTAQGVRGRDDLFSLDIPGGRVDFVDAEWPLRQPTGDVARVRWCAWDPVHEAAAYGVELRDSHGSAVYSRAGIRQSSVRLPWTVRRALAEGELYRWIVTAYDAQGTPVRRAVGEFRLIPGAR